jgi:hypothetical protein
MKSENRIALDAFPEDWKYYTLTYPVARYQHLSLDGIIQEMVSCSGTFYSVPGIFRRVLSSFWHRRKPWISLAGNLSYRGNLRRDAEAYMSFRRQWGDRHNGVQES